MINRANALEYGLVSYVFTKSLKWAHEPCLRNWIGTVRDRNPTPEKKRDRWRDPSLGQLKKRELPLLQDSTSGTAKMREQANKIPEVRTKRRKLLYEVEETKNHCTLSGFQTGHFTGFSNRR